MKNISLLGPVLAAFIHLANIVFFLKWKDFAPIAGGVLGSLVVSYWFAVLCGVIYFFGGKFILKKKVSSSAIAVVAGYAVIIFTVLSIVGARWAGVGGQ